MWVKSCSCSRGFFSGHSPRSVYGRVQTILKKLQGTTSFGPRQTLLPTVRERESIFSTRSSWTIIFSFICPVYDTIPGGKGVNSHMKRLGLLDILLKFCISRILVLLTVFKTTHDHFQLSKYLLGCTRRKNNKRSARISVFTLEFLRSLESSLSLNARDQSFPEQLPHWVLFY